MEHLLDALMCAELEQRVQAVDMLLDKIEKGMNILKDLFIAQGLR